MLGLTPAERRGGGLKVALCHPLGSWGCLILETKSSALRGREVGAQEAAIAAAAQLCGSTVSFSPEWL